jgi:uncharacterized membrane protein
MTGWAVVRALHELAMAFFVGGQLMLAAVVVPAARGTEAMTIAARRFGAGTLIALAVLLATGIPMASHYGDWDDGKLHVKLALVVLIGVLIAVHLRRPRNHVIDAATFLASLAVVYLGVALAHT